MQRTQPALASLIKLFTCATLTLGALAQVQAADKKADPTGTWTWTQQARQQGGQERKMTLKLKLDGDKVTGTLSSPGRGGQDNETKIEDGKLKDDEISFTVTREGNNGNKFTTKYNGKISGDSIKGKSEFERNGNPQSRDWEAKREGDKK